MAKYFCVKGGIYKGWYGEIIDIGKIKSQFKGYSPEPDKKNILIHIKNRKLKPIEVEDIPNGIQEVIFLDKL